MNIQNLKLFLTSAVLMVASLTISTAQANVITEISLPNQNLDITHLANGTSYAGLFTGSQTLGGIPFQLTNNANGNNAFWNLYGAWTSLLTIDTNIFGATKAYTLVNSYLGTLGSQIASIYFMGDQGANYSVDYVVGDNVRDYYYGGHVNTTSSSSVTTSVWGSNTPGTPHLDMQEINLPDSFSTQTLKYIYFLSYSFDVQGDAFLAGVSIESIEPVSVPEPTSGILLVIGLGLISVGSLLRKINS